MRLPWSPATWLLRFCVMMLILSSPALAADQATRLSDGLMREALDAISLVLERDLGADDQAWLRERWTAEARNHPERTIAGLEGLAVARLEIEAGSDPMILAQLRTEVIDQAYCATRRTADPLARRMRQILAPDDLVLAADCVTGVVVTPFDVKALARSNAMVGELVGNPVDAAAMEAENSRRPA